MAYFANGSEGEYYREKLCERCIHGSGDCSVMLLHLLWNYEQHDDEAKRTALEILWPRDGIHNGDCKMFVESATKE